MSHSKSEYVQYAVNIERDRHRFVAQNYEIPLANGHLSRIRALPPMTVIVTSLLELTGTAKIDDGATLFVLKYAQAVLEFTCGSNEERLKALFVATVTEHFRGMRMPQEAFADTSLADVAVKAAVKREQELLATARQYYKRDDVDKVLNVALVKQLGESKSLKFSYVDLVRKLDGYLAVRILALSRLARFWPPSWVAALLIVLLLTVCARSPRAGARQARLSPVTPRNCLSARYRSFTPLDFPPRSFSFSAKTLTPLRTGETPGKEWRSASDSCLESESSRRIVWLYALVHGFCAWVVCYISSVAKRNQARQARQPSGVSSRLFT
jgi:hypothetical protein